MTNVTPHNDENVYFRRKPNQHLTSNHIFSHSNQEIQAADANHTRSRNDVSLIIHQLLLDTDADVIVVDVDVVGGAVGKSKKCYKSNSYSIRCCC